MKTHVWSLPTKPPYWRCFRTPKSLSRSPVQPLFLWRIVAGFGSSVRAPPDLVIRRQAYMKLHFFQKWCEKNMMFSKRLMKLSSKNARYIHLRQRIRQVKRTDQNSLGTQSWQLVFHDDGKQKRTSPLECAKVRDRLWYRPPNWISVFLREWIMK